MVKRLDQGEFSFDAEDLSGFITKSKFTGEFADSRREAEVKALSHRLQGRVAHIQNGLESKYEIVASEAAPDLRKLSADFKEVGTGVWQAGNPDWDNGSLWTLYSSDENGGITLARIETADLNDKASGLTSKLMVATNIPGYAKKATVYHSAGEVLSYVDPNNNFVHGTILEADTSSGGYWVRNHLTAATDFIAYDDYPELDPSKFSTNGENMDHMQDDEFDLAASYEDDGLSVEADYNDLMDTVIPNTDDGEKRSLDHLDDLYDEDASITAGYTDEGGMDHLQDDDLTLQAADDMGEEKQELDVFDQLAMLEDKEEDYIDDLVDTHEKMMI